MDHAEATAAAVTERYLLGDLSAAEADSFEEHYFDCAECAEDLRAGVQLLNGGRGVAREAQAPAEAPVVSLAERRSRFSRWVPAVAAAALVLAITGPVIVRQQRDASAPAFEVASQVFFAAGESRGGNDTPAFDANAPTVLLVDVPSEPTYSRYEARLNRPTGPALTLPFTPDPNGAPTPLSVRGLAAGSHELVIVGIAPAGQQAEISRHRFIVR